MDLPPGTVVGKYVVEELLGRGGMASVYRIRHESLKSAFALKVLDVPSRRVRERLESEGMYQAKLRHPNVVSVLDVVEVEGSPALVMELVEGPSLEELLRVHRPTVEQIDDLARGILRGVRAAHRMGLVHRDLKPANILMAPTESGFVPKIADFGLAKALSADGSLPGRTRTGAMLGTPAYMAPEQFRSARAVDERADVFALGVTLYELCTGRHPVATDDLFELYEQVRAETFPRPREIVPELPERMERAILGALVADPDRRTPSVDALLAAWCGGEPSLDERAATWDRGLVDSVTRSGATSGAPSVPGTPKTWQTFDAEPSLTLSRAAEDLEREAAAAGVQKRPSFARRAAPIVTVMGLALSALVAVVGLQTGSSPAPIPALDELDHAEAPAARAPDRADAATGAANRPAVKQEKETEPDALGGRAAHRPGLAGNLAPSAAKVAAESPAPPAGTAELRQEGDPASVELRGGGRALPPGPVPPGSYVLWFAFDGTWTPGPAVTVTAGEPLVVRCDAATRSCAVTRPPPGR